MKKIEVVSRKYDGSLRDEYEAFLYAEDDEKFVVYAPPGTLSCDHRKRVRLEAPDGLLELYFKTRWYVVWHVCEQNSGLNRSYIHLSTPTRATKAGLEWLDLDLDYRVYPDGRLERLDEHEYLENCEVLRYPLDVQEQVRAACSELEALYRLGAYPFDHAEQVALYQRIEAEMGNELQQPRQRR